MKWSETIPPTVIFHLFQLPASFLADQVNAAGAHSKWIPVSVAWQALGGSIVVFSLFFLPCSTCSLFPRAACTRQHPLPGQTFPASDVPCTAFSLPKIPHVQANKNSKATPVNNQGFFPFTNMSLHIDTRCLRLLLFQFFHPLQENLTESWA